MAPPRKKSKTAPAVSDQPPTTSAPAPPSSAIQDPDPTGADATNPPLILVSGDDCRLPAADQMSPADKYELVMPLSQALATGGVMLMLPATNLNKLYEAKSNSYSQYVDLGTQLPTGRMAPLLWPRLRVVAISRTKMGRTNSIEGG
jgi:hypothetical protein